MIEPEYHNSGQSDALPTTTRLSLSEPTGGCASPAQAVILRQLTQQLGDDQHHSQGHHSTAALCSLGIQNLLTGGT